MHDANFDAFGINGHLEFSQGASENPQIGTIEDWYLINSMVFPIDHPIHIHLINYQFVNKYSLRIFSVKNSGIECAFYEMDFYLENANFTNKRCDNSTMSKIQQKYKNKIL